MDCNVCLSGKGYETVIFSWCRVGTGSPWCMNIYVKAVVNEVNAKVLRRELLVGVNGVVKYFK